MFEKLLLATSLTLTFSLFFHLGQFSLQKTSLQNQDIFTIIKVNK
jgi:hypothetical protein